MGRLLRPLLQCAAALGLILAVLGCPPHSSNHKRYPLEDYFPLDVGNSWTWEFVSVEEDGSKVVAPVTLAIDDKLDGYIYEIWQFSVDGPWLLFLTFGMYLGFDGIGYVVRLDDGYYIAGNTEELADLPQTENLTKVPIDENLAPRVVWIEEEDDAYFQRYVHGSLEELLPSGVTLDDFDPEIIASAQRWVGVYKSRSGAAWSSTKAILGERVGMVLGNSVIGRFYLRAATIAGQDLEAGGDTPGKTISFPVPMWEIVR